MIALPMSLVSGCAQIKSDSYCDLAFPMYFGDEAAMRSIEEHDHELFIDVIVHNETYEELCS